MSIKYMWGEDGQYGPFSAGEDGYPCCGEVVRFYRVLKGYRATEFAELYGRALGEKPKTRIWVLMIERTNDVPTDVTRRRIIADLLGIPYVLLGISECLPKTPLPADTLADKPIVTPRVPKRETLISEVLIEHEQSLATYVDGYFHRHGQAALGEVTKATEQISALISQAREPTQQRGIILISHYYQFGANIAKQQQHYELAIAHADKAIEHAEEAHKIKPNSDLMATAFYRRALPSFEQEITRINQGGNYSDVVSHIDAALFHARYNPRLNRSISLEWGLIHAYTATSEKERTAARKMLMDSYNSVSQYSEDDNTNFLKGWLSWYHLRYGEALIALRDYSEAIGQLDLAEEFTPLTFPRRLAYIDALRAKAYMGLQEFEEAVTSAKDALMGSRTIKSEYNIARIAKVYRQLRGKYKHSGDLTELGRELAKTHPHLV